MAKPGKKKKVLFVLEIIVLLLFIGGLYVYGQISSRLDKIEQPELKKEKIVVNQEAPKMTGYKTYVLFGIDTRGEGSQYSAQNSDTMIIVSDKQRYKRSAYGFRVQRYTSQCWR